MARSLFSTIVQASRAAEREAGRRQRAAAREQAAAVRAEKARERARAQAERAARAYDKQQQREAKAEHVAVMEADVEGQNRELAAIYEEIDGLLAATLGVDDHVDLEALRRTPENPPFDRSDLETPTPAPPAIPEPPEPVFTPPEPPRGIFRWLKNHDAAVAAAKEAHAKAHTAWQSEAQVVREKRQKAAEKHARAEQKRLVDLERERARFDAEIAEHNKRLDTLITNLGYGTVDAVQDYVSIVMSNSVYPDHFPVEHTFTFEPSTAELKMRVSVPPPSEVSSIKAYKYHKASDKITTTQLSQKQLKDRYSGAIQQVAVRSFHEVFEADRRGLFKMISLEVGTDTTDPATGKAGYIPFVAAAAERDIFTEFDLSVVIPVATLQHLGAAISKNPYGLVPAKTTGVRRS